MTFQTNTFPPNTPYKESPPVTFNGEKKMSPFEKAMASYGPTEEAPALEIVQTIQPTVKELEVRPFEYTHSNKVDPPEDWQLEDIQQMYDLATTFGYCANWSEMGCKKTSTVLWLIQRLAEDYWPTLDSYRNPNVWICTTRSGKGTYFNLAPEILEGWYFFNITAQGIFVIQDGKQTKLKLDQVPEYFDMPTIVVSHFNHFSKSNKGQFLEIEIPDEETGGTKHVPVIDPETKEIKMKPWTASDHFVERDWDMCFIDEAHRIKDKDTKWTIIIKRSNDAIRGDMTGTGFINKPHEIWSLVDHMIKSKKAKSVSWEDDPMKIEFGSFWDFRDEFCLIDDDEGYEKVVGIKPERKEDFRAIVRRLGPRRTLSEVMPHIKEPIFVAKDVDLNPVQKKMYDEIKTALATLDQNGIPIYSANVLSLLQRLRGICAATPEVVGETYDEKTQSMRQQIKLVEPSSKLDAVMEILDGLEWDEDRKDPVVIFSNFVGTLKLLQARFERANENAMEMGFDPEYPYLWMKESHNDQERYDMWKPGGLFPSLEYRVFMSTLQLGGESISLTAARHVIFIDRSWSPKDNAQGIGRIRRPGQEGQPIVININANGTVDRYIHEVNNLKQGWFNEIFGNDS